MPIDKEVIVINCVCWHCRAQSSGAFKDWHKTDAALSQPRFSGVFFKSLSTLEVKTAAFHNDKRSNSKPT